jgi:integrase
MQTQQRRRRQYQYGSVFEDPRTHIWYFRWYDADGKRRAERIGKCKSKSEAERKAEGMRLRINAIDVLPPVTVEQVAQRYLLERIPERHSTSRGYKVKLKIICRDLGNKPMPLKPFEVEQWLRTVKKLNSNDVYAGKTRGHIKDMISKLHDMAMFWEYIPLTRNPMSLFKNRGSSKPVRPPVILSVEQFGALFAEIKKDGEPFPTLVFLDACSGIRESELFGLRWRNIDWQRAEVSVERAVVEGYEDDTKSKASKARMPLDQIVLSVLEAWRKIAPYTGQDDFVFASTALRGKKPMNGNSVQTHHLRPAAIRAGLPSLGWHALRHSYRTRLDEGGAGLSVMKELMRHSNITQTMAYGRGVDSANRAANATVAAMLGTVTGLQRVEDGL